MTAVFALLPYGLTWLLTTVLGVYCLRTKAVSGHRLLAGYFFFEALDLMGFVAETLSFDLHTKLLFDSLQYLADFGLAIMVVELTVVQVRQRALSSASRAVLWFLALAFEFIVLSGVAFRWLRADSKLLPSPPFVALWYPFQWIDYIALVVLNGTALICALVLGVATWSAKGQRRSRLVLLLIGTTLPAVAAFPAFVEWLPPAQRDITPLSFMVGGVLLAFGMFRYSVLQALPAARSIVFESVSEAVFVLDGQHVIVDANRAGKAFFEQLEIEPLGRNAAEVFAQRGLHIPDAPSLEHIEQDQHQRYFEIRHEPMVEGRTMLGTLVRLRDVTDLKAREQELERLVLERTRELLTSEQRFRAIFDNAFQFIGLLDVNGNLLETNNTAVTRLEFQATKAVGVPFWKGRFWSPEDAERVRLAVERAAKGEPTRMELPHHLADGTTIWVDFSIKPIFDEQGNVSALLPEGRDISALRKAEREKIDIMSQLLHSQKLETVGRLAGSVAHDFNNLLTIISGNLSLIEMEVGAATKLQTSLTAAQDAVDSAARLTRQLLNFSQRTVLAPTAIKPALIVNKLAKMIDRLLGERIHLHVEGQDLDETIWLDPTQFEQVVLNLLVNARDAMPTGGDLWVSLKADTNHNEIILTVADSGEGIADDIRERIFEPFFTTKKTGTGLGLAMVHRIVNQANGKIELRSEVGRGTTFEIALPIYREGDE